MGPLCEKQEDETVNVMVAAINANANISNFVGLLVSRLWSNRSTQMLRITSYEDLVQFIMPVRIYIQYECIGG
jgi:hypothetical protein